MHMTRDCCLSTDHADHATPVCVYSMHLQAWHTAAEAAAQQAVSDAFSEALLDWQRSIAQRSNKAGGQPGASGSSSSSSHTDEPEKPSVTYDGHQVSVNIPLLPVVDLPALLKAVQMGVDQLASNSKRTEQQQQSWLLSTQRVQHWQLRRLVGGKAGAGSTPSGGATFESSQNSGISTMQQLTVQVVVPLQPSSPHEASGSSSSRRGSSDGSSGSGDVGAAGHVQVAKAAPFTADELELLGKLVAAANKPGSGQVGAFACSSGVMLARQTGTRKQTGCLS